MAIEQIQRYQPSAVEVLAERLAAALAREAKLQELECLLRLGYDANLARLRVAEENLAEARRILEIKTEEWVAALRVEREARQAAQMKLAKRRGR